MYDINTEYSRTTLAHVHADVRKMGIDTPMKAAWVHKTLNTWEFHGPDGFFWHGRAYNAYDARIKGWLAWIEMISPATPEGQQ